jgi:hypothetical protein
VLHRKNINIPDIGLVQVSTLQTPTYYDWYVTFLTYGSTLDEIIVLTSSSCSNSKYYNQICSDCEPFPAPVSNINIVKSVTGIDPVSGEFMFKLSTRDSNGNVNIIATTGYFSPFDYSGVNIANTLKNLITVKDVTIMQADCTVELRCIWIFSVEYIGEVPQLEAVADKLSGTAVKLYLNSGNEGIAPLTGEFQLLIVIESLKVTTTWLKHDSSAVEIEEAIRAAINSDEFDVLVTHQDLDTDALTADRYKIIFSLKVPKDKTASDIYLTDSGQLISLKDRNLLPTLTLKNSSIIGTDSKVIVTESIQRNKPNVDVSISTIQYGNELYNKFLLSVNYPEIKNENEVQAIYCQSNRPMVSNYVKDANANDFFTVSFRQYTTQNIWIHSYVDTSTLIACNSSKHQYGYPCKGDGSTLYERLLDLDSFSSLNISSNSTTGRVCPTSKDVDLFGNSLIFATYITFTQSVNASASKVIGVSVGDVPPLLVSSKNSNPTQTKMSTIEIQRGATAFAREVQTLTISNASLPAGFFELQYNISTVLVDIDSSAGEFASAVSKLIGLNGIEVSRSEKSASSVTWTVTFPAKYGKAFLLQVASNCKDSRSLSRTSRTMDYWEGSSCLLQGPNNIVTKRIVSGYFPMTGSLKLIINSKKSIKVPLHSLETQLQLSLQSIPGFEKVSVTN